jgi:hypothetical protein
MHELVAVPTLYAEAPGVDRMVPARRDPDNPPARHMQVKAAAAAAIRTYCKNLFHSLAPLYNLHCPEKTPNIRNIIHAFTIFMINF